MPKYNEPVQPVKYRYTGADYPIHNIFFQNLEVGKELFGPNSYGLSSAKHIFTRVEDGHFMEEISRSDEALQVSMRANALFVVDKNGFLRQIGLENNNGEIDITVSKPVTALELPLRPTFWTRVKSFFGNKAAREQIKAYNDAKEFNAAFETLASNEKYGINPNPDAAPAQEEPVEEGPEVKAPEVKELEVNQNQQEMQNTVVKEVEKEKPKLEPIVNVGPDGKISQERLRLNTFKDMVDRSWRRAQPNAIEVLLAPGASPEENYDKYYDVIANGLPSE